MAKKLHISFDSDLIEAISSDFDLRAPNKEALRQLIFTLDGDYDPAVMQVLNMATGVGKTYLMAAFIEYLRIQGIRNVVVITPGKIVQAKTVYNFRQGNSHYIEGAQVPPMIVTPKDYTAWQERLNGQTSLTFDRSAPMLMFIFNIQQLIAPSKSEGETHGKSQDADRRKTRKFDENTGVLMQYLKDQEDLVVIADESHLYSTSAAAFHAAIEELNPAAIIGLTGSSLPEDHVIYRYPLYRAIKDQYVKSPVLAFRKGGYGADQASEEQQLRDAIQLRAIKQSYYDAYALKTGAPHLNAILFVVCSDVNHATQIASLLRKAEYFGKDASVLQVDSDHDDDVTQLRLEKLDEPDSDVLAVVSVNKLKEGWDVKNIAVIVTLRAMASEVLTQQTMGRGLRLPFGKRTDVWQLDQLDIISHQSFQDLLAAENILAQFGLEDAVSQADKQKVDDAIRRVAQQGEQPSTPITTSQTTPGFHAPEGSGYTTTGQENPSNSTEQPISSGDAPTCDDEAENQQEEPATVQVRDMDHSAQDYTIPAQIITIHKNPRFADVTYKFPVTMVSMQQPPINLSEITDHAIDAAAKRVTSTGDVLYRKEIIAALGEKLKIVDAESAEVDSVHIDKDVAAGALVKLVMDMQMVPSTMQVNQYVKNYLVPKFMKCVTFPVWTVKSLDSARMEMQQLIRDYIVEISRRTKEVPTIYAKPMELRGYTLNIGEEVYDPINSREQFVRNRFYSGWFKSLFESESFDSYSGEYMLARLLNTSPHIVWWNRLHSSYSAFIYYNAKDRYFPDFVAKDDAGVHWIIEAKSVRGRDDAVVQEKRKAAEALVRQLAAEPEYAGQAWGYLIAYEDDIARADSWDDLKAMAQPVSNLV